MGGLIFFDMKNKRKKIQGTAKEVSFARETTYAGREMTEIRHFLGIWYWFYVINNEGSH